MGLPPLNVTRLRVLMWCACRVCMHDTKDLDDDLCILGLLNNTTRYSTIFQRTFVIDKHVSKLFHDDAEL